MTEQGIKSCRSDYIPENSFRKDGLNFDFVRDSYVLNHDLNFFHVYNFSGNLSRGIIDNKKTCLLWIDDDFDSIFYCWKLELADRTTTSLDWIWSCEKYRYQTHDHRSVVRDSTNRGNADDKYVFLPIESIIVRCICSLMGATWTVGPCGFLESDKSKSLLLLVPWSNRMRGGVTWYPDRNIRGENESLNLRLEWEHRRKPN
jgi:hypothetical protein